MIPDEGVNDNGDKYHGLLSEIDSIVAEIKKFCKQRTPSTFQIKIGVKVIISCGESSLYQEEVSNNK